MTLLGRKLQGMCLLSRIGAIKNCAVVDEEIDTETTMICETNEHEVEAEGFEPASRPGAMGTTELRLR